MDGDIQKTPFMYVVLKGSVTLMKKDHQLEIEMPLVSYKTGECFGDLSI